MCLISIRSTLASSLRRSRKYVNADAWSWIESTTSFNDLCWGATKLNLNLAGGANMDDMDEDRSNTGFAALSAVRRKSEILSDDEPAFTASKSDMVVLILIYVHVTLFQSTSSTTRSNLNCRMLFRIATRTSDNWSTTKTPLYPSMYQAYLSAASFLIHRDIYSTRNLRPTWSPYGLWDQASSASQASLIVDIANPDAKWHNGIVILRFNTLMLHWTGSILHLQ